MSDLIRRDEVLETYADIYFDLEQFLPNFKKELDKIYDALQAIPTAEPNEYVKDGTLTVQMPTMKEAKSIEKVVVYADTYKQEYSLPKVGEWIRTERTMERSK